MSKIAIKKRQRTHPMTIVAGMTVLIFAFVYLRSWSSYMTDSVVLSEISTRQTFESFRRGIPRDVNDQLTGEIMTVVLETHRGILGFGQDGREAMDDLINHLSKQGEVVIFEVGVWLGSSVARWLKVDKNVRVVATDPFHQPTSDHKKLEDIPEDVRNRFGKAPFNRAVTAANVENEIPGGMDRTVFMTGYHPQASKPLFDSNLKVDLFYLDGGKRPDDPAGYAKFVVATMDQLLKKYPGIVLSGDDYNSQSGNESQFQSMLKTYARRNKRHLFVKGSRTWIMVDDATISDRLQGVDLGDKQILN